MEIGTETTRARGFRIGITGERGTQVPLRLVAAGLCCGDQVGMFGDLSSIAELEGSTPGGTGGRQEECGVEHATRDSRNAVKVGHPLKGPTLLAATGRSG